MKLNRKTKNKIVTMKISEYFTQEEIIDCMDNLKSKTNDGCNFLFSIVRFSKKFMTDKDTYELTLSYDEKETDEKYIDRLTSHLYSLEENLKKIKIILDEMNETRKV